MVSSDVFLRPLGLRLAYGGRLFSNTIGIDTEVLVNDPQTAYNWLIIGRFGGFALRKFLEFGLFSPYYAAGLSALFLVCAYWIWRGLIVKYLSLPEWCAGAFWLLFVVHPIWEEQAYFELQLVQITFGLAIIGVTLWGCLAGATERCTWRIIPIIIGLILCFSIYQSFVILFIAASCFLFLQYYRDGEKTNIYRFCIFFVSVFLISYLVYSVISKIWFSSSTYLTSQILWQEDNIIGCIKNILLHIESVVLGHNIFFTIGYFFSLVLLAVQIIIRCSSRHNFKLNITTILAFFLLEISPFLLTIYLGGQPLIRTQWALPLVISANFILFFSYCTYKKIKYVVIGFAIILGMQQLHTVCRLEYTDQLRYQHDVQVASMLSHDLEENGLKDKPVAFIGNLPFNIPPSGIRGEIIGISFFDFDMVSDPHYYMSSVRIVGFMNAIGEEITCVQPENILYARRLAQNMPCWPQEGGIKDAGDYVVVKLSEDEYYEKDFG